jgi:hypothetical protein
VRILTVKGEVVKEVKSKPVSQAEQRRQQVLAAMPEVKELVKRHSLSSINGCLTRLRESDKKARQANKLRQEADKLEQELSEAPVKLRSAG